MAFCQRLCNRVFQPPLQLRGVRIYSHGCKQGCFQPPGRVGLPGLALRTRRSYGRADGTAAPWWRSTPGVRCGRVSPVAGMRRMSQRSFGAVAVLTVRDCCRAQHRSALQQPLGLGRHGSAPGGWRTCRFPESLTQRLYTVIDPPWGMVI